MGNMATDDEINQNQNTPYDLSDMNAELSCFTWSFEVIVQWCATC